MAIDSVIMSLVGVVIGAGITTGLAYVLAVRRENAERSNWRRDQCLTAYTDVLNACATIHFEAMATYMADANTEEQVLHAGVITKAIAELQGHVDKVLLLSPKEMYDDLSGIDIDQHAQKAFGAFQNDSEYGEVVWKFKPDAASHARAFLFHPTQVLEDLPDGSLLVRFDASGHLEMCWYLYTWGDKVEVLAPEVLRKMVEPYRRSDFLALPF